VSWFWETILIALGSLWANKLRTVLTVLGVVIGIGTIIGMLSLINGINRSVMSEFERLGPNVLYLTNEEPGIHVGRSRRDNPPVTVDEVESLRRTWRSLGKISIVGEARGRVGFRGRKTGMLTVSGVEASYADIYKLDIAEGRFFEQMEGEKSQVCILGSGVVNTLFGSMSAVGREVDINGRNFRVLGALEESGTVLGQSLDDTVIIPYRWFRKVFGKTGQEYAMASPAAGVDLEDAVGDLSMSMRIVRSRGDDAHRRLGGVGAGVFDPVYSIGGYASARQCADMGGPTLHNDLLCGRGILRSLPCGKGLRIGSREGFAV
jgi:putative ABC transport system permease protein